MRIEWAREIRDACREQRVPFFFKQWGGFRPKSGGRELDGRAGSEWPSLTRAAGHMLEPRWFDGREQALVKHTFVDTYMPAQISKILIWANKLTNVHHIS